MAFDALPNSRRAMLLARLEMLRLRLARRRIAVQAGLVLTAILLGLGGVGMLMMCLHAAFVELTGPVYGALLTGGLLITISVAILIALPWLSVGRNAGALDQVETMLIEGIKSDFESAGRALAGWEHGLLSRIPLVGSLGGILLDALGVRSGPARALLTLLGKTSERSDRER